MRGGKAHKVSACIYIKITAAGDISIFFCFPQPFRISGGQHGAEAKVARGGCRQFGKGIRRPWCFWIRCVYYLEYRSRRMWKGEASVKSGPKTRQQQAAGRTAVYIWSHSISPARWKWQDRVAGWCTQTVALGAEQHARVAKCPARTCIGWQSGCRLAPDFVLWRNRVWKHLDRAQTEKNTGHIPILQGVMVSATSRNCVAACRVSATGSCGLHSGWRRSHHGEACEENLPVTWGSACGDKPPKPAIQIITQAFLSGGSGRSQNVVGQQRLSRAEALHVLLQCPQKRRDSGRRCVAYYSFSWVA